MQKLVLLTAIAGLFATPVFSQWIKQNVNTTASFRGLSVVNEKVVWASGTGGTVIRTVDAGKTWDVITVPGAEKLDFRDIEAFDANTAYILSIGNGDSSRIYKTVDGGKTWNLQFKNNDPKAFYDAIACWDKNDCVAMSDPVDHKFPLIQTKDGGKNWATMDTGKMPEAKDGEAAFAASGTCLITHGKNNLFLVTGGTAARVFKSTDRGATWSVAETPIVHGTSGSGIFSIAMFDHKNGVIVGGNYEKPVEAKDNLAFTSDAGKTWKLSSGLSGYRSAVAYLSNDKIIAVGSNGADILPVESKNWIRIDWWNLNAVKSTPNHKVGDMWAVGPNGLVGQMLRSRSMMVRD